MNNQVNKEKQIVEKFAKSVDSLKRQIVNCIKMEKKLLKDVNHAKSENDKKALMDKIRSIRHTLEAYRTALNDLTYAFLDYHKIEGLKIAKKFGYKTVEGYLADKKDSIVMPRLGTMIELIANHYPEIPRFYKFEYSGATRQVIRNYSIVDKRYDYGTSNKTFGDIRVSSVPNYVTHEPKTIEQAVASGTKHR